jgi:hypothetical protein
MIMYTEFLAATIEACGRIEDDYLAEAFDRLDSDDTGYSTCIKIYVSNDTYSQYF